MINSTNWGQALNISLKSGWSDDKVSENLSGVVEALDQLSTIFVPEVSESFLLGSNVELYGARPIDALSYGKTEEVFEAIAVQKELMCS